MLAISCSVSASSASTVTVSTPLSFPPTTVGISTDGPLPCSLSELSHLTRVFFSETVVGILGAVFTLFRVTASEAGVFSAVWVSAGGMVAAVVGAGDVEDVMTPVAVAVAAVVVLAVGPAVLAFAVFTDFAVVATIVVAVATTVVAVAAGVAVAGARAVGSEEGVTVAVSSSRLSTPALFRYACNMKKLVISAFNALYAFVLRQVVKHTVSKTMLIADQVFKKT
jgi:hypothetical protein